ncbi:retrovirus-related pol polyprotein from transposon TNT 1-94 [Tanacetum coccineum]
MQDKKPDLSFFYVFGSLCYPTNDHEDLGKFDAKVDIGIFVGYAPAKKAFRIYNRRTWIITETIHVTFDELTAMASEQFSSGLGLHYMTPTTSSTRLVPNPVSQQPFIPPKRDDWDRLFQPMFDEYFNPPPIAVSPVQEAASLRAEVLKNHQKTLTFQDDPLNESPNEYSTSHGSSSNVRQLYTPFEHLGRWTKDHPIANVIGDPSRSVSTRKQLETDAMWCYFDAFLTSIEPKNFKQAMTEPSWIDAMQEEIHEFERLKVWELVSCPDNVFLIKLKWIYKVKTDESGGVLKNKARLVAQGFRQEEGIDFEESFAPLKSSLRSKTKHPVAWYDICQASSSLNNSPKVQLIQHSSHGMLEMTYYWMSMMGKNAFFVGLQISSKSRGIFINQSKYASKIVKKYGLHTTDYVDTPMIENKKLDEDLQGKPVDATLYRGMIGSLMYLTSSRPDLNYVVCFCARYQAKPTEKHL